MSKTELNTKVSTIRPRDEATEPKTPGTQEEPISILGDSYQDGTGNAFKGLVDGQPSFKAEAIEPALIGELIEYADNASASDGKDPMQALLGSMMFDGLGGIRSGQSLHSTGEIPYVPDLVQDIFRTDPGQQLEMLPVVERYVGLEQMITALIKETELSLHPRNASNMTTLEIRDRGQHLRELNEALCTCREQLQKARYYNSWDKADRAAAYREDYPELFD